MALLIGSPNVGKTLLLKRLNTFSSRGNYSDVGEAPSTIATVGTNLVTVVAGRRGDVTVREVGGCMAPIWKNYYTDCSSLMFMMDVSNRAAVASSCIQLCEVLSNPGLHDVPVLIILNKTDADFAMKRMEFDGLVFLDSVIKHCKQSVTVVETSAKNGQGLQAVTKWLQEHARPS